MGHYPQTESELFQLAALFRQSAEKSSHPGIQEKLRAAAVEIEARARAIAPGEQALSQADSTRNLFAPFNFTV